jgi:hypothetical protein
LVRDVPIILKAGLPGFGGAAGWLGPAAELEDSAILGVLNWGVYFDRAAGREKFRKPTGAG